MAELVAQITRIDTDIPSPRRTLPEPRLLLWCGHATVIAPDDYTIEWDAKKVTKVIANFDNRLASCPTCGQRCRVTGFVFGETRDVTQ